MRILFAIWILLAEGCTPQPVLVVDDFEAECQVTEIIHNKNMHAFSVETYECNSEAV